MSYGQRDPYHRPDPYAARDPYRRERGYHWTDHHCSRCGRVTAWNGAGRADPAIEICLDCGAEERFA